MKYCVAPVSLSSPRFSCTAAVLAASLTACVAAPESASVAAVHTLDVEVGVESTLSGEVTVDDFHVPAGDIVWITDDCKLHATGSVLIEGQIRGIDRSWEEVVDQLPYVVSDSITDEQRAEALSKIRAPSIHIVADEHIELTGRILGGSSAVIPHGLRGWAGVQGAPGGSIELESTDSRIDGVVYGGRGGGAGPAGKGGKGGTVIVRGPVYTTVEVPSDLDLESPDDILQFIGIMGGHGGPGGRAMPAMLVEGAYMPALRVGSGGGGGDALYLASDESAQ